MTYAMSTRVKETGRSFCVQNLENNVDSTFRDEPQQLDARSKPKDTNNTRCSTHRAVTFSAHTHTHIYMKRLNEAHNS